MIDPRTVMTAPADTYVERRRKLALSLMRPLVVFAGHAPARNYAANPFPFRASSSYRYFGGPPLENAALLIEPASDGQTGSTLFRVPMGPDDELWMGALPADADLLAMAGLPVAAVADADRLSDVLAGRDAAFVAPPCIETRANATRLGLHEANEDELLAIINQRLRKDEHELIAMRRAASVAMEAHRAARAATRVGIREADTAAAFYRVLIARQAEVSFNPIITIHGEVLHGHGHPNEIRDGDLMLIDAGAEETTGYASDITRTFPANGKWTPIQRHLYETVERALHEATAACVPGKRYREVHDLAAKVICEGLVAAELLRGDPDDLVKRAAHTLFFPHGVGHLLGMDVHDMEDFGDLAGYAPGRERRPEFGNRYLRLDRDLEPGYAVTIEPGIYFVPAIWACDELTKPLEDVVNRPKVDALLADSFGGIRLEDDVVVRASGGPEVLTGELRTDADEVAAAVGTAV